MNPNSDPIEQQYLEDRLTEISEIELGEKLQNYAIFDYLNGEKITPVFLRLASRKKNNAKMVAIKIDVGQDFHSDRERKEFITEYYKAVYKKPRGQEDLPDRCIEEFLGPEICKHRVVQTSKLTAEERNALEA